MIDDHTMFVAFEGRATSHTPPFKVRTFSRPCLPPTGNCSCSYSYLDRLSNGTSPGMLVSGPYSALCVSSGSAPPHEAHLRGGGGTLPEDMLWNSPLL